MFCFPEFSIPSCLNVGVVVTKLMSVSTINQVVKCSNSTVFMDTVHVLISPLPV